MGRPLRGAEQFLTGSLSCARPNGATSPRASFEEMSAPVRPPRGAGAVSLELLSALRIDSALPVCPEPPTGRKPPTGLAALVSVAFSAPGPFVPRVRGLRPACAGALDPVVDFVDAGCDGGLSTEK